MMGIAKRLCSFKFIAIVALLLFLLGMYVATRDALALSIELGMDRESVLQALGKPMEYTGHDGLFTMGVWRQTVFNERIYQRTTVVAVNKDAKVVLISTQNILFGYCFISERRSER